MEGFKCKVTGSTKTTPLGSPKPPVWCQGNPAGCTKGPKQFIAWHQLDGNNVEVDGLDLSGFAKSPGYNSNMGFSNGEFVKVFFPLLFFSFFLVFVSLMERNRCSE